ncbi:MAG: helix-turn-helix domain-containing protein, partial [Pyrinomonadaceae bacterium]
RLSQSQLKTQNEIVRFAMSITFSGLVLQKYQKRAAPLQVAAQWLRESRRSIAQIADEVGYESEATFTRAFKREMGITPERFRRGS